MEEDCSANGNIFIRSKKSRIGVVSSDYSLRETPARSASKPELNLDKIPTPQKSNFSSSELQQVVDSEKRCIHSPSSQSHSSEIDQQLPRKYPSRIRASLNFSGGETREVADSDKSLNVPPSGSRLLEADQQLPRRYPSRVRVSAVERSSSSCPSRDEKSVNSSKKRERKEEEPKEVSNLTEKRKVGDEKGRENWTEIKEPIDSREKVKEILDEFQLIYKKLVDEDESKEEKGVEKTKKTSGERSRFDLDAFKLFKEKHKELNYCSRSFGSISGVDVGDEFGFRVELFLLGLHRQLQANIDYVKQDEKLVAVSVVLVRLEEYNGNVHKSDTLLCCGSGKKNRSQKLEHGNLALNNSIDAKTPIRVIHCFQARARQVNHCQKTNEKKVATYIYGGLYLAERYWRKKDKNGHSIFIFQLRRMLGQPELNIKEVKKSLSLRVCSPLKFTDDVSQGEENIPVRVVNTIDGDQPVPFKYITDVIYPPNYCPGPPEGCGCVEGCSDSVKCACVVKNGGEIPFNCKGAIVEAKPLVYECGPSCKCPPSCQNRSSQHGIKFPLEIFKTRSMGWGVRSRAFIPSGSFICEYVGELIDDEEAPKRTNDEYLFDIGNNYYDKVLWEGLSASIPSLQKSSPSELEEDVEFTVDASEYGNVGRFINHSCTPNLYAQNLLFDHDDKRLPHIMLFASEDISPLTELTYHYNYTIDEVLDPDGNIKKKNCYCGTIECTGRLY